MNHFTGLDNIENLENLIREAIQIKETPFKDNQLGKNKTLVMLFFNASLRTRLSTEKAARNLGMEVMVLNVNDSWQIEFGDGAVMDGTNSEHIIEAAKVIGQYADVIAVRAFPTLKDRGYDEKEVVLELFKKYAGVPIINMESATAHPLQALTDAITITEYNQDKRPKVVLSWAPHPKALPQAVANSFVEIMQTLDVDLTITHPKGYELNQAIVKDTPISYNQAEAMENADFIYAKNWSSYNDYGKILTQDKKWMMTKKKLGQAKFMHCLPVRRNVVVEDSVLDSSQSLVIHQANNRTYAAQAILKNILLNLKT